jgi:predicted RNase H-like nuclease (RuvC/YqgF family)
LRRRALEVELRAGLEAHALREANRRHLPLDLEVTRLTAANRDLRDRLNTHSRPRSPDRPLAISDIEDAAALARENRRLAEMIRMNQRNSAAHRQKDEAIQRLKGLVTSQESTIGRLKEENGKLKDGTDLALIIARIEGTLDAFRIDGAASPGGGTFSDRLQRILRVIAHVKEVFDE